MADLLAELTELDEKGFILPPEPDPASFCETARRTLDWSQEVRDELTRNGEARIFGQLFAADQLVPPELLLECLRPARTAYGINPTWVPAFFSSKYLPWYVGGTTFYESADGVLHVCLLLREPFRQRHRWLIYDRAEVLSHEACHVARAGLREARFEERLAYAISGSALRRALGGSFRGRWEARATLGSAMVLMGGAALEVMGLGPWVKLFCALPLVATVGVLVGRATRTNRILKAARLFLEPVFAQNTAAVLFRCTDEEIVSLSQGARNGTDIHDWLDRRRESLRWQLIRSRFLTGAA